MPRPAAPTVQHLRDKIRAVELIDKAQGSVLDGESKLSSADVGIIKLLLNKVIPDLKGVEHSGSIDSEQTNVHRVTFRNRK